MSSKLLISTGACAMLAVAGYFGLDSADRTPVAPPLADSKPAQPTDTRAVSGSNSGPGQRERSLFSGTASHQTTLVQQRYEAREKRMAQGGYGTPAEYFYIPLSKLNELAANGNMFALLQLGQQYWDESDTIASEPGFDTSAATNTLAVEYFTRAIMTGATQPALMLASRLSASDPSESYAWALFAEKLQIGGASEMASHFRARLSNRDIDAARVSAEQKFDRMVQASTGAKSDEYRSP